jgi:dUTP pyrophosphatase
MIDVKIKLLYNGSKAPRYQRPGDVGMDVFACIDHHFNIHPGRWETIPLGFAMELPEGYGAFIIPRSGISVVHGINIINSPGLIDANYRGEVKAVVYNGSNETFRCAPDARIAQMVIMPIPHINWVEVDELEQTNRGDKGFGSSGV